MFLGEFPRPAPRLGLLHITCLALLPDSGLWLHPWGKGGSDGWMGVTYLAESKTMALPPPGRPLALHSDLFSTRSCAAWGTWRGWWGIFTLFWANTCFCMQLMQVCWLVARGQRLREEGVQNCPLLPRFYSQLPRKQTHKGLGFVDNRCVSWCCASWGEQSSSQWLSWTTQPAQNTHKCSSNWPREFAVSHQHGFSGKGSVNWDAGSIILPRGSLKGRYPVVVGRASPESQNSR